MTTAFPTAGETASATACPTGAALAFNPVLHGLRGLAAMAVLLYHWRGSYPALAKACHLPEQPRGAAMAPTPPPANALGDWALALVHTRPQ